MSKVFFPNINKERGGFHAWASLSDKFQVSPLLFENRDALNLHANAGSDSVEAKVPLPRGLLVTVDACNSTTEIVEEKRWVK